MARDINLLDSIQIATPCHASWSAMKGDDRVRFCEQCSLHVFNIAEISREDAEKLIVDTEGRLCARLYRRHDGTVITKDCPVGLIAARRKLTSGVVWLAGALTACMSLLCLASGYPNDFFAISLRDMEPFQRMYNWISPPSMSMGSCEIDEGELSYTARHRIEQLSPDWSLDEEDRITLAIDETESENPEETDDDDSEEHSE